MDGRNAHVARNSSGRRRRPSPGGTPWTWVQTSHPALTAQDHKPPGSPGFSACQMGTASLPACLPGTWGGVNVRGKVRHAVLGGGRHPGSWAAGPRVPDAKGAGVLGPTPAEEAHTHLQAFQAQLGSAGIRLGILRLLRTSPEEPLASVLCREASGTLLLPLSIPRAQLRPGPPGHRDCGC